MKFSTKIFTSLFLLSLVTSLFLVASFDFYFTSQSQRSFNNHYSVFLESLGKTLTQLEKNSEQILNTSNSYIAEKIDREGLPSNEELKSLSKELGVTHIYVIAKDGRFVRSTKEPPSSLPNFFSFCPLYSKWFEERRDFVPTGIMPGIPSGLPMKFAVRSTKNFNYIVESGIHGDFFGYTLESAMKSDHNMVAIGISAPNGQNLGIYPEPQTNSIKESTTKFVKEIPALHDFCCSCIKRGLCKEGYFYSISATVSTVPLSNERFKINFFSASILLILALASFVLSRKLASKLVHRLSALDIAINEVVSSGGLNSQIEMTGSDEITRIGQHFSEMIGSLRTQQALLLKAERKEAIADIALQVAHDIRTPLAALKVSFNIDGSDRSDDLKEIGKCAVERIDDIAKGLLKTANNLENWEANTNDPTHLVSSIDSIINEAKARYSGKKSFHLFASYEADLQSSYLTINPRQFYSAISNLVNNAVEAVEDGNGEIQIVVFCCGSDISIHITDNGRGIPSEIVEKLGNKRITYGKLHGNGLGCLGAKKAIENAGGEISFASNSSGATVRILLPILTMENFPAPSQVIKDHSQRS